MGTSETAATPGSTIEVSGNSPPEDATIGAGSMYAGLLVIPSVGTYGNGIGLMSANYGDSNVGESMIRQIEIPEVHPQSTTPYDKATVYVVADPCSIKYHIVGQTYWLKASSLTAGIDAILVPAGSGLVKLGLAHTASSLPVHQWGVVKAVTSATWVQAEYLGRIPYFTANS